MKSFLVLAAAPLLAVSIALATTVEPQVGPFHYQQSWKLSSPRGHGTMFPILKLRNGTIFMTAKHVTRGIGSQMMASHPEYGIIRTGIKVIKEHPTLDLATVFVPVVDRRIRSVIAGPLPKLGDKCIIIAYPGPGIRRITEGRICGPDTMSAQIIGGSSGGPVFSEDGHLIGVVRAVSVQNQGFVQVSVGWMGWMTPVTKAVLRDMLRD